MRKKILALLLAATMAFPTSVPAFAEDTQAATENGAVQAVQYLTEETEFDGTVTTRVSIPDGDVAAVRTLESFSITVDFKTTNTGLMALAAVNGSAHTNDYISLYISGGTRIGFELRNYTGSIATVNDHHYVDVADANMANGKWHTITFVLTKDEGYKVYLDKENVLDKAVDKTYFAGTEGWWEATSVTFGGANRISGNSYLYTGSLRNAKVYTGAISEDQVMEDHAHVEVEIPDTTYPEGVYKTEEYGIYDMGDYNSYNYRIPALVTTKNGVVLAAADQRNTHWSDWGNIDTVVRRSTDNGLTWEDPIDVIDLKTQPYFSGTQSAFLIDPVLIATESGRVWMLVDMFPESTGAANIDGIGTGYVEVDGVDYLALYDEAGAVYTLRGNEVYDADGNKTSYTVDEGSWEDSYHTKGDLYDGDEYVGNIFLKSKNTGNETAPLTIKRTMYLWLTYSDDDGKTWSNPVDITPQVKDDWMKFCGVGPGFGIELQHGEHKGRLVFPIYYTCASGGGIGFQSSACIYSDDGGLTWTRGESPNDGRINSSGNVTNSQNPSGISQLTESQIIELSSGNLLQFMRNTGGNGKVSVARSTDGGETWSDPIDTSATEVYCQLSVFYLDNKGIDGKDRVLMSNPGGSGRNNGMLRIGEITETEDSFTVEWVTEKMFCPGNYAYSCLTQMADGNFGLLYEHSNTIKFTAFNEAYITEETNLLSPTISSVSYDVEKTDEHAFAMPGDTYVFTVNVSQEIVDVKGNPQFRFILNNELHYADLAEISANGKVLTFEYEIQEGDEGLITYRGPKIVCDEENYVKNASGYTVSAGDLEVSLGYIGTDPSDDSRDIPVAVLNVTAGDYQSGEGPEMTLDGDSTTTWHTDWYAGPNHDDHWIQLELSEEYMVDGLRYQPRQSGTNGIITGYNILVSNDGETFTSVAEGTWDANNAWKTVSFDPQNVKYVRLQTTSAMSDQAIMFASAAEIRLTGVEAVECEAHVTEIRGKVDATCTEAGYTGDEVCTNCGTVVTKGEEIEALGHTWGEWEVVKEATTEDEGLKERVCATCGVTEEEIIPVIDIPWENPFKDVVETDWYYNAVAWGSKNNVVAGIASDMFYPAVSCTRAQIVSFLWRAENRPEPESTECKFQDVAADAWYYKAVLWATENGIVAGYGDTVFAPEATCTRAEMAAFIWRLEGRLNPVSTENPFTDLPENEWYTKAAQWTYENGIVSGYDVDGGKAFAPDNRIARAETVTMLYRYYN